MGEKGRRLQVGDTQPRVLTCFNITGYKHSVRTQPDTSGCTIVIFAQGLPLSVELTPDGSMIFRPGRPVLLSESLAL